MQTLKNSQPRRLLWNGPFFGRLTKAGRSSLLRNGWKLIDPPPADEYRYSCGDEESTTSNSPLALIWPSKSGPQFPIISAPNKNPALVRPFPVNLTDILNDKIHFDSLLKDTTPNIIPKSISCPSQASNNALYYVKHRHGVQGKSVYVHTKESLVDWWHTLGGKASSNHSDFIIQEEISPALDDEMRKFALRTHVLIMLRDSGESDDYKDEPQYIAALHKDIICHTHPSPYNRNNIKDRLSHISNEARNKKKRSINSIPPSLIAELPPSHPACDKFDQIKSCIKAMSQAFYSHLISTANDNAKIISPKTTCFVLMGVDCLISSDGSVKMCEVNSHPALGWGTMSDVPSNIYDRLIEETLSVLLLEQKDWNDTGFRLCHSKY